MSYTSFGRHECSGSGWENRISVWVVITFSVEFSVSVTPPVHVSYRLQASGKGMHIHLAFSNVPISIYRITELPKTTVLDGWYRFSQWAALVSRWTARSFGKVIHEVQYFVIKVFPFFEVFHDNPTAFFAIFQPRQLMYWPIVTWRQLHVNWCAFLFSMFRCCNRDYFLSRLICLLWPHDRTRAKHGYITRYEKSYKTHRIIDVDVATHDSEGVDFGGKWHQFIHSSGLNSLRPSDAYMRRESNHHWSDNGLSPGRRQAIIQTNAGILLIGPLGTKFNEIVIGIQAFSVKKMHLKMSSGKWRSLCLGLNVLIRWHMPGVKYSRV